MPKIKDADHFSHRYMKSLPLPLNHESMINNCQPLVDWHAPATTDRKRNCTSTTIVSGLRPGAESLCSRLSPGILIPIVLAFFMGCSSITAGLSREKQEPPDAAARAEAQAVLSTLSSRNAGLNNFKGKGKIKVWQAGRLKIKETVYWIGSETSKISIVLLIGGYPAIKMANDGKWFYYYEVGESDPIYKKIAASEANLKRIISISIQTDDVLSLLAGRVPIREHHSAILAQQEAKPGYVLTLKKRWWGVRQKIYLDQTKTQAQQVEFYNRSGSLIYRARFDEMQSIKGYLVPARLSITNGTDADFELDVNAFWADVAVTPSMFVLNPPK